MLFSHCEYGINMPSKRHLKNYRLVEVIQPKNYMTLVNERLPKDLQEIILDKIVDKTQQNDWMEDVNLEITDEVADQKPFHCDRGCWGFDGEITSLECDDKVCKCHCCLSENSMSDFTRAAKFDAEYGVCMVRARRVIGRKKAIPIPYYRWWVAEYWLTARDVGGHMMGLKPKDEVIYRKR
tara:strand:- start:49 stop:591 length:543 start_codon:yes stop_codon:yes gene_type:complete